MGQSRLSETAIPLRGKLLLPTLLAVSAVLCAGQNNGGSSTDTASGKPQPSSAAGTFHDRYPRYSLRKGDSFDLEFPFSPEFNQTVVVQPDGYITLRGAGTMHVEGQTIPELTETIKKAYGKILHDPEVTVALKDFERPYFVAGGQVAKPGKYDLRSDLTLVEAINIAGGLTDASKHSQVVLFRRVPNDMVEARVFDVKKMLAARNLQEDPHLMPGDMLFVPQNAISKIRRYLPTSSMGLYSPTW